VPVIRGIPGDATAKGQAIITNADTVPVRYLEWGLGADATSPMLIDSDSLDATFGGSQTTRTGAYDPDASGNSVIRCSLAAAPTVVCGTGEQPHRGTYRVKARVFASLDDTKVRLTWQDKDGPWTANPWATPPVSGFFAMVDLGPVHLDEVPDGAQTWAGRIEAYNANGGTIDVDLLVLVPTDDGYGVARAVGPAMTGTLVGRDDFAGTTAGSALGTRTPPVGAAWATSGATTDFTFLDAGSITAPDRQSTGLPQSEAIGRSASSASLRFAVMGSVMTDQEVSAQVGAYVPLGLVTGECGVIARWVDAGNYLRFTVTFNVPTFGEALLSVTKVVAGSATVLATRGLYLGEYFLTLTLAVSETGSFIARHYSALGALLDELTATDAVLATGGALDDGKAGVVDSGDGTHTLQRFYDNVAISEPAPEPIVIYSGRDAHLRDDSLLRASEDGSRYGRPPSYQPAGYLLLEPSLGDAERDNRFVVLAHRNDLTVAAWEPFGHRLQVQVLYTPRGGVIPR
jgi:hypothetical protein